MNDGDQQLRELGITGVDFEEMNRSDVDSGGEEESLGSVSEINEAEERGAPEEAKNDDDGGDWAAAAAAYANEAQPEAPDEEAARVSAEIQVPLLFLDANRVP